MFPPLSTYVSITLALILETASPNARAAIQMKFLVCIEYHARNRV